MLIIGHRGAAQVAPENTIKSVHAALLAGVDMIEVDVHASRSGDLVVIHDHTVNRTTNGTGRVDELTLEQIRQLTIDHNEKIPILTQVIEYINKQVPLNIELKGPSVAHKVAVIINHYLTIGWQPNHFLVSSFNHFEIQTFSQFCPNIQTGAILYGLPIALARCVEVAGANTVCQHHNFIIPEFVADAHARGLKVFVYTVNDEKVYKRMVDLKVDGIFSDTPHFFCAQEKKRLEN